MALDRQRQRLHLRARRNPLLRMHALQPAYNILQVHLALSADRLPALIRLEARRRLPLHERVVNERLQNGRQGLPIIPQYFERDLAGLSIDPLVPKRTHRLNHVVRETKRDDLRHAQSLAFVKQAVEVDVNAVAVGRGHQNVLAVAIAQTEHIAANAHHSCRSNVVGACVVPRIRLGECAREPLVQNGRLVAV